MSKAFLLTRHSQDTPQGIQLEFWFSSENGPLQVFINAQQAIFFIRQEDIENTYALLNLQPNFRKKFEIKALQLKDFSLNQMAAIYFHTLQIFYRIKETLQTNNIAAFETDIRPTERYLTERFITGPVEILTSDNNQTLYNPKIKPANYEPKLRLMSIDIETSYDTNELFSIAYICDDIQQVIIIGDTDTHIDETPTLIVKDERELLNTFMQHIINLDPDIFIGWNVINFDFNFLQTKADALNLKLRIGRNNALAKWRKSATESNHYFLNIHGRVGLDGRDTLKSAKWKIHSFYLDKVAKT